MRIRTIFLMLSPLLLLGIASEAAFAKSCNRGKPCGNACIPMNRVCKVNSPALGNGLSPANSAPSRAGNLSEAVLVAQDANAQINLRANPTTTSQLLGYGLVGDTVQVLQQANGRDGFTWYQVRFFESRAVGWIRGDFVRLL